MRTTYTQSNMTSGELSPDMWARIDHPIFTNGLSKAQNVVIMPHGGVRRRPGLTKTEDSRLRGYSKLFAFEFSVSQDYVVAMSYSNLSIYKDGVKVWEASTSYTLEEIDILDAAQAGDVMIFAEESEKPKMLRRLGADDSWEFIDAPLSSIPVYDFGTGDEPVWSDTRGWPSVTTFFQQRLWFGGSTQRPQSVWASKINSYYDFNIGDGEEDFAIFDTIDTDQFNKITNIFPGRNLMVFTLGSEFYNTADYITSSTSTWKRSTGYGAKRIRPVLVDGAAIFADRVGRTVRSSVYEFGEDAFIAPSISLVSNHLITDVVSMDAVKGTNIDVSDFVYIINKDGTAAVLNTIRHEEIKGWTQWTTEGDFRDVCVVNKIVYFVVEREGEYHLEYMNEGTTTDHNTIQLGTAPIEYNVDHKVYNIIHREDNVVHLDASGGVAITEIDTGESRAIAALVHRVLLDGSVQPDSLGGVVEFERPGYHAEVGLDVKLAVHTMPLNTNVSDGGHQGVSINRRKRVIKLLLDVNETLGLYGNSKYSPDRKFTVVLDKVPEPFTGLKEIFLLGWDRVTIIELSQNDPLPFKLVGLGHETEA